MMTILQPPGWARPRGFSHGVAVRGGTTVYIAGQIGSAPDGTLRAKDFAGQFRQALENIVAVVAQAGGGPQHIVRMTWYVLEREEYAAALTDLGAAWRELMGRHYPVMAVLEVSGLVEPGARLEIEATAVVPD